MVRYTRGNNGKAGGGGFISHSLKVKLEEHKKAKTKREVENSALMEEGHTLPSLG